MMAADPTPASRTWRSISLALIGLAAGLAIPVPLAAQASPSAHTYASRYDIEGRVTGQIAPDPDGTGPLLFAATRNVYDAQDRLIRVDTGQLTNWQSEAIAPANWTNFEIFQTVETVYDSANRPIRQLTTGSDGVIVAVTDTSYDMMSRVVCTTVRMNPATFAAAPVDACTHTAAGPTGPDRISRNIYDNASRVIRVERAVGTPLQQTYAGYSYTASGQRREVFDANGNRATYTYNELDRLVRWTFPSPASTPTNPGAINAADYEEYSYDNNGNRLTLRKRDGSLLSFEYDALGRVVRKTVPERAAPHPYPLDPTHTRDVFYRYDLRGLQLRARFDSIDGEGITNSFDGMGRLNQSSMTMDGVTRTLAHQWTASGVRSGLTHPDGTQIGYAYDGLNRAISMQVGTGGSATTPVQWTYTARGGIASTIRPGAATQERGYDAAGRMASLGIDAASSGHDQAYGFTFTPARQIGSRSQSNDAYAWTAHVAVNRSYAANGLNQYSAVTTGGQTSTFQHDLNGNLASDGNAAFVYDVENRLVSAPGATLRYDPLGRLYEVADVYGAVRFLYDGDALVGEYKSTGRLLRRYLHGIEAGDDPLVWFEGTGVATAAMRHLVSDERGSVVGVTDASGNMLIVNSYDEYGIPAPTNLGRFQYTGQAWIPEIGLYHYKARVYSPTLGRFLQTDPVGYDDQQNLYAYVANDPINLVDPEGTCLGPIAIPCAIKAGELLVAGAVIVTCALFCRTPDVSPMVSPPSGGDNDDNSEQSSSQGGGGRDPQRNERAQAGGSDRDRASGSAGGERAGRPFTRQGRETIDRRNAEAHGRSTCENCRQEVVPGQRHERGVTPPRNERQRDHVVPRSRGGDGSPSNGQVLCRGCNRDKSDRVPE